MRRPPRPAPDIRDHHKEALGAADLSNELALKRAEERIAAAKGERDSVGARWMLRRLRHRLFGQKPPRTD